jgi:hypothetical protein
MSGKIMFGKWHIYYDPKPIPTHAFDWSFYHDDYDGAPDSNDCRHGYAESIDGCIRDIKEMEDER